MDRQYITITEKGDLAVERDQMVAPDHGEIAIDVAFAGINRADILQRMGLYPVPPDASPILGLEVAGTVASVGGGVSDFTVGDRVCALVHGGGYASAAIARADHTLAVPDELSLEQAAALPEALLTVWHNVFTLGRLSAGETLLIHGGGSGIGSLGIQMAKCRGARVLATAGGSDKCQRVEALGADWVADYKNPDLLEKFQNAGYGGQVDVILDMAGGDFVALNFALAAPGARIVCIGMMRGSRAEIDLISVLTKRLTLTGSTLRGMNLDLRAREFAALRSEIMPAVAAREIVPVISECFPLADAMVAHERMQSGSHMGKLLLDCG